MALVGARRALLGPTSWIQALQRQVGSPPDYVVDPGVGNDTNAGTKAAPWATITKLVTALNALPSNASKVAFIRGRTYTNQPCDIAIGSNTGCNLVIAFERGASLVWNLGTSSGNGIGIGNASNALTVYGNGVIVSGFNPGSGNGLGCNNANLTVHNVAVTGADDGCSTHGTGNMAVYDSTFADCTKGAFTHTGTGNASHYRCAFTARAGATLGVGSISTTNTGYFEDCTLTPAASGDAISFPNTNFLRSTLGTTGARLSAAHGLVGTPQLTDCFVNMDFDGDFPALFTRCYGKLSMRVRGASSIGDVAFRNCVLVGSPSGDSLGLLYSGFDAGDGNWDGVGYDFRDCIVTGYVTAIGGNFTAGQLSSFNANSKVDNIATFGNTTGIVAGITIRTNELTANPTIGAHNTTRQTDYGYLPGSPCIGAGFGGGNIGFSA